jgi:5'-phosphate synthase pdxT subunit
VTCQLLTASQNVAGKTPVIGVLALQGDVREHVAMLTALGARVVEVRTPAQFSNVDALVIPGGESSVIDKLSRLFDLHEPIHRRISQGMPAFGTCAGLIMLANDLADGIDGQITFGGLDVTVQRNAFGAQVDSFETEIDMPDVSAAPVKAAFIRAPIVTRVGTGVRVLGKLDDERIVAVESGNVIGISFHPEVEGETAIHKYFLERVHAHVQ